MGGRRDGSNSSDASIEPLEYTMVSWGDSPCLEEGQLVSVNWYTSDSEYRTVTPDTGTYVPLAQVYRNELTIFVRRCRADGESVRLTGEGPRTGPSE